MKVLTHLNEKVSPFRCQWSGFDGTIRQRFSLRLYRSSIQSPKVMVATTLASGRLINHIIWWGITFVWTGILSGWDNPLSRLVSGNRSRLIQQDQLRDSEEWDSRRMVEKQHAAFLLEGFNINRTNQQVIIWDERGWKVVVRFRAHHV